MSRDALAQQLGRQAHVADFGHAGVALGSAALQHQHRRRRRPRGRVVDARVVVLDVLEHHRAAAMLQQGGRGGRRLDAPRRRGARLPRSTRDAAVRLTAAGRAAGSRRGRQFGASRTFSPDRLAVHGRARRGRAGRPRAGAQHRRQAAGVVELLHQEARPTASGRRCSGHVAAERGPSRRGRAATPTRPAMRQQMDDGVGRAADRGVDADRVLERLARQELRQRAGPRATISTMRAARPSAPARSGARRRPGSPRCCGSATPSASAMQAMVEAVPMVMQVPARAGHAAPRPPGTRAASISPALTLLGELPDVGARADVAAAVACR